jgi:hypothetical protein
MARKLAEVVVLDRRVVWHTVRGQAAGAAQRNAGEKSAHLCILYINLNVKKKKRTNPSPKNQKLKKTKKTEPFFFLLFFF